MMCDKWYLKLDFDGVKVKLVFGRAAQNNFCLVSKVFPEEFVLQNTGLFI